MPTAEKEKATATEPPTHVRIGLLSEVFHCYMDPIMAARGNITEKTLPKLPYEDSAVELLSKFRTLWEARKNQGRGREKLYWTVSRLLFPRFPLAGAWLFLDTVANFAQPFIVRSVVRSLRLGSGENVGTDYALIVLLALASLTAAASLQQVLWNGARIGLRARLALSAAVYGKTLRLGNAALLQTSAGQATNLVAIDCTRLELAFTFFHFLWNVPLNLMCLALVLSQTVGLATLPAIAFLIIVCAVQWMIGEQIARLRQHTSQTTDGRVKLMRDVLSGSEALRANGWAGALTARVQALRAVESRLIWRSLTMLSALEALIFFAPGLATFLVLITRTALDATASLAAPANCTAAAFLVTTNATDAADASACVMPSIEIEEAYMVLGLCNVMVKQFNTFPRAIKTLKESFVSFRRIQRFLDLPEVADGRGDQAATVVQAAGVRTASYSSIASSGADVADAAQVMLLADKEIIVLLDGVTASWGGASTDNDEKSSKPSSTPPAAAPDATATGGGATLIDVSVSVTSGELLLVAGEVGSGKSSLLELLLGEMDVQSGRARVNRFGGVGYAPQSTWIINASVRENILLGRQCEDEWYAQVLRSCALEVDLHSFADGDATEIGERGVTVSGGQKARISLARALYGRPALLLLDDPLSAVDQHVARHLVQHALIDLAKRTLGATVVLVSHQLQFAEELADRVLVLAHGRVVAHGPPAQVAQQGLLPSSALPNGSAPAPAPAPAPATAPATTPAPAPTKPTTPTTDSVSAAPAPEAGGGKAAESATVSGKEALAFYLSQIGVVGCVLIMCSIVGLAAARALADWALGRWISSGSGSGLYAGLTAATVALGFSYALSFTRIIGAASRIHHLVLRRVLHAPKSFFDTTPLGLLLNLFSKDMDTLDELLPLSLNGFAKCVTIVGTALVVSAVAAPAVLVVVPFVWIAFRKLSRYFLRTSQVLKRLDKATSGPLFSLYAESLHGVTSVRAFGLHAAFESALLARLDTNHAAHFLWTASSRWFALRLDWITSCVVLSVGVCVLLFRAWLAPALAALALTYILQISSLFQWGFRMWAECTNHFVSVERALQYTRVDQEASGVCDGDAALAASAWPTAGALTFDNVCMCYRPGLPLVLKHASFTITGGAKAAVVGRSGAGKSSLSVALLRLAEIDGGRILIDGIDVRPMGLTLLRRAITFIQQDAVLFAGTIRSNLDPFREHTPPELEQALAAVDFARLSGSTEGIDADVSEAGANLSAGLRQLLLLARALLDRSRLLLMDEATANCDQETDARIQAVVRECFSRTTLLTIAHRLDTIIDYDQVIVMADGRVAEDGPPASLLDDGESLFSALVDRGGKAAAARLRASAQTSRAKRTM